MWVNKQSDASAKDIRSTRGLWIMWRMVISGTSNLDDKLMKHIDADGLRY